MRTIVWNEKQKSVEIIDQNALPLEYKTVNLLTYQDVVFAIQHMTVRGAPAIGVTGAYGMALAALHSTKTELDAMKAELHQVAQELGNARPTAVNLWNLINHTLAYINQFDGHVDELKDHLLNLAHRLAEEDVETNVRLSKYGAELINDGDHIVHHCNTGALATVDYGTALGVIRMAHEQGKKIHVYVDETRPRLQGARLTAWELKQYGIPYDIITDSSSGHLMQMGLVDKVFFGADRVAMNGDVANKIGSYMLALAAVDNKIPVYSVFPVSTVDAEISSGKEIEIEQRDSREVLDITLGKEIVVPSGATAVNYAFDVTPNRLLTGLVTEHGVLYPPFFEKLDKIIREE